MNEYACKDLVFHFNKKHLEDPTIPMWVIKTQGETFYVTHVDCQTSWSTKETPENSHTKGSIKIKNCLLKLDDDNCATITALGLFDKMRLKDKAIVPTRIIMLKREEDKFKATVKASAIEIGPVVTIAGACSSGFIITDILDKAGVSLLGLSLAGTSFRILMPNEAYYKMYDNPKHKGQTYIDEDDYDYGDEDQDDETTSQDSTGNHPQHVLPV